MRTNIKTKKNLFAGSNILSGFILKRDKVRLLIWILSLSFFVAVFIPVFKNVFSNSGETERMVIVEMMKNPAMIAIVGPVYGADHYTTGAMYGNFMLVFSAMIAAVMNIFLVTRHTRHDEELGRLEVIRSLPVGRLSNLASTLFVSFLVNAVLSILTGILMFIVREDGMNFNGCMLFGVCLGIIGFFFAAATACFCQFTTNNRTATSVSCFFMLALYMLRAAGDINPDMEILALISPLGLILRTKTFVENHWWPVFVVLGISIVVLIITFMLASIRDLDRGLLPERQGKRHGSALLSSPYGLAFKLSRTSIIIWAITVFVLAGLYGSVFGDLDGFIESNDMLKAIFAANTQFSAAEQFMSLLMVIMSLIAAIPVLSYIGKVAAEEKRGHSEHILGKSVSKYAQMASYLLPAVVMSVVLQLLSALGFWVVGSQVLKEIPSLTVFLKSAFSYLPAIWIFIGISAVLTAYLPDKMYIAYLYLGYSFFAVYLGTIAGFPDWTTKITPFGYISNYPIEEIKVAPLIVLSLISVLLCIVGFVGYRRRDVKNPS